MPVPIRFWNSELDTTVVLDHTRQWRELHGRPSLPSGQPWSCRPGDLAAERTEQVTRVPDVGRRSMVRSMLYPNPTNAILTVALPRPTGTLTWRVLESSGRPVEQGTWGPSALQELNHRTILPRALRAGGQQRATASTDRPLVSGDVSARACAPHTCPAHRIRCSPDRPAPVHGRWCAHGCRG